MPQLNSSSALVLDLDALVTTGNEQSLKPLVDGLWQVRQAFSVIDLQLDMAKSIAESFQKMTMPFINLNFQFSTMVWPLTESDKPAPQAVLLTITTDEHGARSIGGKKTTRMNAKTSRHGQLLDLLEDRKGRMVSKDDIKARIKAGDPVQTMKDLKKDLRLLGFQLDYVPHRHQGWVYNGIIRRKQ